MGPERHGWRRANAGRPLVVAHRGASALCTENTVPAFERARADGADGVELDVLCCASGEVVVFHDDDLLRLAGRPQRVADLSWSELRQVRLPGDTRIPLLAEAFEACGPGLLVNVELKSAGFFDRAVPRLVEAVARVVGAAGVGARVLASSFDPRAVWLWQRQQPAIPAGFLFEGGGLAAVAKALCLPWLRAGAVHPEQALCRPDLLAAWHAAGYPVNTWTVDDPDRLRCLAALGVDALITNDPAAARQALAQ